MSPQRKIAIALFRNDLRIHDNPVLQRAWAKQSKSVTHFLPLYVFDERIFDLTHVPGLDKVSAPRWRVTGSRKTGRLRTRFVAESVFDLRENLRKLKSDLLVAFGKPETVLQHVVQKLESNGDAIDSIWIAKEYTSEEITVERNIKKALKTDISFVHSKTLVHPSDLPFKNKDDCPNVYTEFRKRVEGLGADMVRSTLEGEEGAASGDFKPVPEDLFQGKLEDVVVRSSDESDGDTMRKLLEPFAKEGSSPDAHGPKGGMKFEGGESAALKRLSHYTGLEMSAPAPFASTEFDASDGAKSAPIATYKGTRNGLIGADFSTKFSPWLASGSLSPRLIWEAIDAWDEAYTSKGNGTKDSYWIRFELLWRDYFVFIGRKFGTSLFKLEGIRGSMDKSYSGIQAERDWISSSEPKRGHTLFETWKSGKTGVPFIDANMNELRETGYMSNRGRQNVASFLAKNLNVDWRAGAEVFEEYLLDYDPTSNWGNWAYSAGVGTDPRDGRLFNPIKQAKDYDGDGEYVKHWVPSLSPLGADVVHHPWTASYGQDEAKIPDQYRRAPNGERSEWKGQYKRSLRQGDKRNGNPGETVEHFKNGNHGPNNKSKRKGRNP